MATNDLSATHSTFKLVLISWKKTYLSFLQGGRLLPEVFHWITFPEMSFSLNLYPDSGFSPDKFKSKNKTRKAKA